MLVHTRPVAQYVCVSLQQPVSIVRITMRLESACCGMSFLKAFDSLAQQAIKKYGLFEFCLKQYFRCSSNNGVPNYLSVFTRDQWC